MHQLGILAHSQGDLDGAQRLFNDSLTIAQELGDQNDIAISFYALGTLAVDRGNKVEAERLFSEALAIFRKLRSPHAETVRQRLERMKSKTS